MKLPQGRSKVLNVRGLVYHVLAGLFLFSLSGCQTTPALPPGGCACPSAERSRLGLLAGQLGRDSVGMTVRHPLYSGRVVCRDALDFLGSASRGLFGKRLAMRLLRTPPLSPDLSCASPVPPTLDLGEIQARGLVPAHMQVYPDGTEALQALEQVIASATCRLDVLMFTWDHGPFGQTIAERLAARAGPNLRVRVLVDGGGNLMFGEPKQASAAEVNRVVCWLAQQPYVEVIRTRDPFVHFDHRKLVLADGRFAWAGGRNFSEVAFFERHDLSYTVAGPITTELQSLFECFWQQQGGKPADCLPNVPVPDVNAGVRLVQTGPLEHSFKRALYQAVDQACHHVWLENPYFADGGLVYKLARARQRGVDVRVVLTVQSHMAIINQANSITANRLLKAGVRVYLYPGLLHTKSAAVDGCWAYAGSGNFDLLSLRRNHELGMVVEAGPVIAEVENRLFRADFQPQWELHAPLPISLADWLSELATSLFL